MAYNRFKIDYNLWRKQQHSKMEENGQINAFPFFSSKFCERIRQLAPHSYDYSPHIYKTTRPTPSSSQPSTHKHV